MARRIIIADDQESWCTTHRETVEFAFPDVRVDEVETEEELIARVLSGSYSVVLSDRDMGKGKTGL